MKKTIQVTLSLEEAEIARAALSDAANSFASDDEEGLRPTAKILRSVEDKIENALIACGKRT